MRVRSSCGGWRRAPMSWSRAFGREPWRAGVWDTTRWPRLNPQTRVVFALVVRPWRGGAPPARPRPQPRRPHRRTRSHGARATEDSACRCRGGDAGGLVDPGGAAATRADRTRRAGRSAARHRIPAVHDLALGRGRGGSRRGGGSPARRRCPVLPDLSLRRWRTHGGVGARAQVLDRFCHHARRRGSRPGGLRHG